MTKDDLTKKRRKYAYIFAAVLVPLVAGVTYLASTTVDLTRYKARIIPILSSRVEGTVSFDTISIKFLPSPDIRLTNLKASGAEGELISARSLRLHAALLPFLSGKTVFKDVEADGMALFVKRYPNGDLNIRRFFRIEEVKKEEGKEIRVERETKGKVREKKLAIQSLRIADGFVKYVDEKPSRPATFEFSSINASSYDTGQGVVYQAVADLNGSPVSISGVEKGGIVKWAGTVKGLPLSVVDPYLAKNHVSLTGNGDIFISYDSGLVNPINAIVFANGLKISHPKLASPLSVTRASAKVEVSSGNGRRNIFVRDALFKVASSFVKGSYSVSGAADEREFSLEAATTPVRFDYLKSIVPSKALKGGAERAFNDLSPANGTITVRELTARGLTSELKGGKAFKKPGAVTLSASIDGLAFMYKGLKHPVSGVYGSVIVRNNALKLEGFRGSYGKETLRDFEGFVKDLTGKMEYEFSLDAGLDAGESIELAKDLVKSPKAQDALGKLEAGGAIDLDAKAWGSFRSKAPPRYSGALAFRDGWLSYEGAPRISEASASIAFDDKKADIESMYFSDGLSSLKLTGSVEDYSGGDPFVDLALSAVVSGGTIDNAPALEKIRQDLFIKGEAALDANIIGRKGSFLAKASLDTLHAGIEYKKYLRKEEDYPLAIDAEISFEGKMLGIKGLSLAFGSSRADVSGKTSLDMKDYELSMLSRDLKIADLDDVSPLLDKDFESSGLLSFMIKATKAAGKERPVIEGDIRVEDARFQSPYIAKPVEKIKASAFFKGNKGKVFLDKLVVGETELSGYMEVPDIEGRRVDFTLDSPRLLTTDFIVKKKKDADEDEKPEAPKEEKAIEPLPVTGSGRIRIAEGALGNHPFTDLKMDIRLEPEAIVVEPFAAEIDYGSIFGKAEFLRGKDEPLSFRADAEFSKIKLERLISGFGAKKTVLSGDLKGAIALTGKRGAHPFASGLNGSGKLKADRGRLWKFPFLSSIFSVVNILSIDEAFREGLQYKTLGGDFKMKDGVLTTENLALDSDTLRMSAAGDIDVPDRHIDALLALHPFVTIDKIISSIPLAGWIITGKDKSTVSMYFAVEGPLKKPDVDPVPIKSISDPVLGILERLIEAPGEIIQEIK
ncbi:MAG: AsmA-like C-terminal domain-containing protein [Deltaproteobacteria bacterium]|nr:AsmA-like C-terminal domain-containing protein [Deltaproteobacteria bacterium]